MEEKSEEKSEVGEAKQVEDSVIELNFNREIFRKYWWVLLILIPLVITTVVRLQPGRLMPIQRSAEDSVARFYANQLSSQINSQYPNLPEAGRSSIVLQELEKIKKQEMFRGQVKQTAEALKLRLQYESGSEKYAYLGDIDSYYWLRMARNIIEKGTQCDILKDGLCYDSYTVAPNILPKPIDYYPIAIVIVYKVLKLFNSDLSLMQASFLTPLAFSLLLTIPLFLLLRRLAGNAAAVIGTVLVNVNPFVLSRTLGSDSDITNVFFQAVFLWLAVECFYSKEPKHKYIWAALAGVCLSIYSLFWIGWWYLADLFIIAVIVATGYKALKTWLKSRKLDEAKKPVVNSAILALSFFIPIFIIFGLIINSPSALITIIKNHSGILNFKIASNINYWPNVLPTVAEFHGMSLSNVFGSFGKVLGVPALLAAIIGAVFLTFPTARSVNRKILQFSALVAAELIAFVVYSRFMQESIEFVALMLLLPLIVGLIVNLGEENEETHIETLFLLTTLVCLVAYFSMIGARFLFIMTIPLSILVAVAFAKAADILISTLSESFQMPKLSKPAIMAALIFFILLAPARAGYNTAQNYMPSVNDAWAEALGKINAESKPDAIINSWWDFGHWFKYFADRRVTLDGSSQDNPQLHWLGKLLLSDNENTSVGILRMLDCGGNNAFEEINKRINDTPHSIDILNKAIVVSREGAEQVLAAHNFTKAESEAVLNYTHCSPPENFLITSQDMIGKSGVWAHFGSWDFKRAYMHINLDEMDESEIVKKFSEDYDMDENETRGWIKELRSKSTEEEANSWIAPWPSYITGLNSCTESGNLTVCIFNDGRSQIPVAVDLKKKEAFISLPDGRTVYPDAVAFAVEDSFEIRRNEKDTAGFGIAIMAKDGSASAAFMSPQLAGSMFTRLFFFDGAGTRYFEKFHDTTSVFGERIITWKVRWA